jgi:oligoribonuclease
MLVWIDTETTGLDFANDTLLEVAVIITTDNLKVVDRYNSVIKTTKKAVKNMDEWCMTTHGASGLLTELMTADKTMKQVENEIIALLDKHGLTSRLNIAGNSIHFDVQFLRRQMPTLMKRFSHQTLDVTSIGLCMKRWNKAAYDTLYAKKGTVAHRAMADIESSIKQLKFYKKQGLVG